MCIYDSETNEPVALCLNHAKLYLAIAPFMPITAAVEKYGTEEVDKSEEALRNRKKSDDNDFPFRKETSTHNREQSITSFIWRTGLNKAEWEHCHKRSMTLKTRAHLRPHALP